MSNYFDKVRDYVLELDYSIISEDENDGVIVIDNEDEGIKNLVLVIADPLLIVEQYIFEIHNPSAETYKQLLIKSREVVHGAFVLDDSGSKVIFRNTHELENLDLNEIEATFNSLALLLSEYSNDLLELAK